MSQYEQMTAESPLSLNRWPGKARQGKATWVVLPSSLAAICSLISNLTGPYSANT